MGVQTLVKAQAFALGFDLVGIATLGAVDTAPEFERWLDNGMAGEMEYLVRGREKRRDSRLPFPGAKSAIVVAMNYGGTQPPGPVARYARGRDYHDVIEKKLRRLLAWLRETLGEHVAGKPYVDTGPLLERDLARKAGLGWFGKNTNLINPRLGSFFFIGALVVDAELTADQAFTNEHCGTCTRCIEACPTNAIVADGVLDSNKCISYLTIEQRGDIPEELREGIGALIYGCDICQEVCPWNKRFSRDLSEPELAPDPELANPDLAELLTLTDAEFRERFRHSPIKRARRAGLARNVAVALGNRNAPGDAPTLEAATQAESDPMVLRHCTWALARLHR